MHQLIEAHNRRYIAAGLLISDTQTNEMVEIFFQDRFDPKMEGAFDYSSVYNPLTDDERAEIAGHNSVAYLVSREAGVENAQKLARFAAVLCGAGGAGVKIEAARRAVSANYWVQQASDREDKLGVLYDGFVFPILSESKSQHFGCGMTQFGLRDTYVDGLDNLDQARRLIRMFDYYRLAEGAKIDTSATFSVEPSGPKWRVSMAAHPYEDSEDIDFSKGVWKLQPA